MVLYIAGRTLYGMVTDNAGTIERLTACLLALKQDFDSAVASQTAIVSCQTAIVSFRIREDVSKMRACFFGDPHTPR
jgi:hypothetical protein